MSEKYRYKVGDVLLDTSNREVYVIKEVGSDQHSSFLGPGLYAIFSPRTGRTHGSYGDGVLDKYFIKLDSELARSLYE